MKSNLSISNHILPTSATMVGICITVISIIRLTELSVKVTTMIDAIMFFDSVLFMISCILSYISLRSNTVFQSLEKWADMVFLAGLVLMVFASFLLAWEFGIHDLQHKEADKIRVHPYFSLFSESLFERLQPIGLTAHFVCRDVVKQAPIFIPRGALFLQSMNS